MSSVLASPRDPPASRRQPPIRLMIVDDSTVARAVLSRMIEADGDFDIIAVAGSGEDAIQALRRIRVDVVMLDLEMPGAGGLKSIPGIIEAARGARILIVSSLAEEGAEATVQALAMGASDTLPKPGTGRFNGTFSDVLLTKLRALGRPEHGVLTRRSVPASTSSFDPALLRRMADGPVRLLGLGASTGGIHALASFFETLPAEIGVPIVVTQHLPAPFMQVFARQLGVAAKREALVAEEGIRLLPDRILVAPGDANLTIDISAGRMVVRLDDRRSASGCLPSVDPMFSSAGNLLGSEALGVVFTGMGRDGLEGARHMVATGGSVLVQDAATSAVWGMPRAIADAGLACGVHPPVDLARRVANRIREGSCK